MAKRPSGKRRGPWLAVENEVGDEYELNSWPVTSILQGRLGLHDVQVVIGETEFVTPIPASLDEEPLLWEGWKVVNPEHRAAFARIVKSLKRAEVDAAAARTLLEEGADDPESDLSPVEVLNLLVLARRRMRDKATRALLYALTKAIRAQHGIP